MWIIDHFTLIMSVFLMISEAAAGVCQLIYPDNQGVSGVIAALIKLLQRLGATDIE